MLVVSIVSNLKDQIKSGAWISLQTSDAGKDASAIPPNLLIRLGVKTIKRNELGVDPKPTTFVDVLY